MAAAQPAGVLERAAEDTQHSSVPVAEAAGQVVVLVVGEPPLLQVMGQ